MREIYRVDTVVLKSNKESILSEQNSFINSTYKTFLNGYICNSSDSKIIEMKNRLTSLYNAIEKSYSNITKWFNNYISDVDNLELSLQTRTNQLNSTGTYSQRILSAISPYINYNKNDIEISPNIYDDMSNYIKNKKEELNAELNKIDDREAYVSKFGEEEGTRKYNEAINDIKRKELEYDEILNKLDTLKDGKDSAISVELEMYQETLNLLYQTKEELEPEVEKLYNDWQYAASPNAYEQFCIANGYDREDPVAIETWQNYTNNIKMSYIEKQAALDELNFLIKEYENAVKLYPYYSLCGTGEYESFVASYDLNPQNGLKGKDNKINQYALYELAKSQGNDVGSTGDIELINGISINDAYKYLTNDEKNIYNYLYCTKGSDEALNFLKLLSDNINKQKGLEKAQKWIEEFEYYDASFNSDNIIEVMAAGIATEEMVAITGLKDGLDSYVEGLSNVLDSKDYMTSDEYARAFIYQYIIENVPEYKVVYKVTSATGNMLPTIIASMATSYILGAGSTLLPSQIDDISSLVGKLSMGLTVYGNSMHNAKLNGLQGQAAVLYSLLCSGSEVLLESLLGGLPFISKEESKFILARMFSEGKEEFIQEFVSAWINAIFYGETIEYDELGEDALESFFIGALVCGLITGSTKTVEVIIDGVKYVIDINQLSEEINNPKYKNGGYINWKAILNFFRKDAKTSEYLDMSNALNMSLEEYLTYEMSYAYDQDPNIIKELFRSYGYSEDVINTIFEDGNKDLVVSKIVWILKNDSKFNTYYSPFLEYMNNELNGNVRIEKNIGENLERITDDDEYIYGTHNTRYKEQADLIYENGLIVTDRSDLSYTVNYYQDDFSMNSFLMGLTATHGLGYGMVVKIPKKYAKYDANGNFIEFSDEIYYYRNGIRYLKPEFIVGEVEINNQSLLSSENTRFKENAITKYSDSLNFDYNSLIPKSKFDDMTVQDFSKYQLAELYDNDLNKLCNILKELGYTDEEIINIINNNTKDYVVNLIHGELSKKSDYNKSMEIRKEVVNNIDSNWSDAEKARSVYIELNKRTTYSTDYFRYENKYDVSKENENLSYYNWNGDDVICTGWARLYKQSLIDAGIDESKIEIKGTEGSHQWVEITLDSGEIIVADGTTNSNFGHGIDMNRVKYNASLSNFVIVDGEYSGLSVNELAYDENMQARDIINNNSQYKKLKEIDKKIGYIDDDYFDVKQEIKEFEKIGSDFDAGDIIVPEGLDGYDYYHYLKLMNDNGLEVNDLEIYLYQIDGKTEGVTTFRRNNKYVIYSESLGVLVFDSYPEYNNFVENNLLEVQQ